MSEAAISIVLAQSKFCVGDVDGNTAKILKLAAEAQQQGAQLIVFPELALTGYPPEDLLLRVDFREKVEFSLAEICRANLAIDIVLGYVEYRAAALHNAAAWIADGKVLGRYFKQQLPNYSVFDEKRYFTPGSQSCVIERFGCRIGLTICEDIWAETAAVGAAQQGAELLLNINASPYHLVKNSERQQQLRARNRETGCAIAYVNLVGGQDELVFDGHSLVVDANGQLHEVGPVCEEALIALEYQPHKKCFSALPQRQKLTEEAAVYQALVRGVRDYVDDNGFPGVVIGLSGGIDSGLTLAIAVDALGADRVEAVMMPSRYTADISLTDARDQAERLGVHYHEIVIGPLVSAFSEALAPRFAGLEEDTTEENIQARSRGVLLMAISNKSGRMVLTTGNKSEMAVGYATLYGDMAGGFAPLKDLLKTWVFKLARYRNTVSEVIPERVITRPPSAELREDQQDSDSLPDYDELDAILAGYVEQDLSVDQLISQGFPAETVHRVASMVKRNEYKRRQAPPGVRITKRAFGKDRRYPITSGFRH